MLQMPIRDWRSIHLLTALCHIGELLRNPGLIKMKSPEPSMHRTA
jgi:hypothetical protein